MNISEQAVTSSLPPSVFIYYSACEIPSIQNWSTLVYSRGSHFNKHKGRRIYLQNVLENKKYTLEGIDVSISTPEGTLKDASLAAGRLSPRGSYQVALITGKAKGFML